MKKVIISLLFTLQIIQPSPSETLKDIAIKTEVAAIGYALATFTTHAYNKGFSKDTKKIINKILKKELGTTPRQAFTSLDLFCVRFFLNNLGNTPSPPSQPLTKKSFCRFFIFHVMREFVIQGTHILLKPYNHPFHKYGTQSLITALDWSAQDKINQEFSITLFKNHWANHLTDMTLKAALQGIVAQLASLPYQASP